MTIYSNDIEIDAIYNFKNLAPCNWVSSGDISESWYLPGSNFAIERLTDTIAFHPKNQSERDFINFGDLDSDQYLRFCMNDKMLSDEVDIRFTIESFDNGDYISISIPRDSSRQLLLYLTHFKLPSESKYWNKGCVLACLSVAPIRLWGTIKGFACTVRSSIQTTLLDIDPEHAENISSTLGRNPSDFLSKRCYMFSAWWSHLDATLRSCYSSAHSTIFHSNVLLRVYFIVCEICYENHQVNLDNIMQLPIRSVQQEFSSFLHLDLCLIRSKNDSDYMSSLLPMVSQSSLPFSCQECLNTEFVGRDDLVHLDRSEESEHPNRGRPIYM